MSNETIFLFQDVLLGAEIIAALIALIYYPKVRDTYWKWFVYYLVLLVLLESGNKFILSKYSIALAKYITNFVQIPIQFMFFYWLYGLKSLKNKNFYLFSVIGYLGSLLLETLLTNNHESLSSISYSIGTSFLIIYILLEFLKQIKSENILNFAENKMFYISIGVILGYLVNFPFHAFFKVLYTEYTAYFYIYTKVFYISFTIMYLFFSASFIWGKPN